MNKRIKKLYTCCLDNRVAVFDMNFQNFCDQFKNIEPEAHSCRWFYNKFKEDPEFEYELNGKTYFFQKLL